jgi:zinc D-Ala-D-Ala carboxypeptidase
VTPRRSIALALTLISTVILLAGTASIAAVGGARLPPPPGSLPACVADEVAAFGADYDDWAETLVDPANTLGASYQPPDLLRVEVAGTAIRLRAFVFPDLDALLEAAASDGVTITVTSGYRSFSRQSQVLAATVASRGQADAELWAAKPGHSEHQLGTTVDLSGGDDWLRERAWEFGFVMSYPAQRSPAWTCYAPEPWHYRYFGRARAAEIQASGLSPREWLWLHQPWRHQATR